MLTFVEKNLLLFNINIDKSQKINSTINDDFSSNVNQKLN